MSNPAPKGKVKRMAKGKRAHIRKMKQEARQAGVVYKAETN